MPFTKYRKFQVGLGKGRAGFSGLLSAILTQVAVASGASVALHTHTLPVKSLYKDGMGVRFTAWGTFAGDADAGTVTLRIGGIAGTVIATATKTNAGIWKLVAEFFRRSATATLISPAGAGIGIVSNTAQETNTNITTSFSNETDIALVVEADATNANDIVCEGSLVEVLTNG